MTLSSLAALVRAMHPGLLVREWSRGGVDRLYVSDVLARRTQECGWVEVAGSTVVQVEAPRAAARRVADTVRSILAAQPVVAGGGIDDDRDAGTGGVS